MKAVKVETLEKALEMKRREYANKLSNLTSEVDGFSSGFDATGRISTHDGFNLGARAQDLQECAGQVALIENLIRFAEEL